MKQKIRRALLLFSLLLFPMTFFFFSPVVIVGAASQGFINGSAMVFGFLLLTSILFSRLFCGWLCPAGALQSYASKVNNRHWNSTMRNMPKFVLWLIWFSAIVYLWYRQGSLKIDFKYMWTLDASYLIIYSIVVLSILIFTLATGKRGMCHSLCWISPFMILGEKISDTLHLPRFKLIKTANSCIHCGKCDKYCPMSLPVSKFVSDNHLNASECIQCLECVDVCPKKVIHFGFKK